MRSRRSTRRCAGKSETYLKDERALEDYLVGVGLDGAVLKRGDGLDIAGEQLRRAVDEARGVRAVMSSLHSRYDRKIVEQAAIAGALNLAVLADATARRPLPSMSRSGSMPSPMISNAAGQAASKAAAMFSAERFAV